MLEFKAIIHNISQYGSVFKEKTLLFQRYLLAIIISQVIEKLVRQDKDYQLLLQSIMIIMAFSLYMLIVLAGLQLIEIKLCSDLMFERWSQFMKRPIGERLFFSIIATVLRAVCLFPVLGFVLAIGRSTAKERKDIIYGMAYVAGFILSAGLVTDTVGFVLKRASLPDTLIDWLMLCLHGFGVALVQFTRNLAVVSIVAAIMSIIARKMPSKPQNHHLIKPAFVRVK